MEVVAVKAASRSDVRSKGAKQTREEGKIPGVVYGDGQVAAIAVEFNDIRHAIYTPEFKLVELDMDGDKVSCIVKEVQFHPVTEEILHLDFLKLVPGSGVKVSVPVRFEGAAPGLRAGGKLVKKLRRVEIKANPENLVDHLAIDISELELGSSVRVKDVILSDGIELLSSPNIPVASIEVPRALKSAEGDEEGMPEDGAAEGAGGEEGDAEAAAE